MAVAMSAANVRLARPAAPLRAQRARPAARRAVAAVRAAAPRDVEAAKAAVVAGLIASFAGAPLIEAAPAYAVVVRGPAARLLRSGPSVASPASCARLRRAPLPRGGGPQRAAAPAAARAPRGACRQG